MADVEGGHEVSDFRCHPLLTGFRRLFRAGSPRARVPGRGAGQRAARAGPPAGAVGAGASAEAQGEGARAHATATFTPCSVTVLECSEVSWLRSYGVPFRAY